MASEFIPLNEKDTKELRKEIGLPVTKGLIYWYKEEGWKQCKVFDYEIIEMYQPSGSMCMLITLESGRQVRILSDYLADMQKPSFLNEIGSETEKPKGIGGRCGERVEGEPDTYVVVDLETTGKNHFHDEITEIGAIKYVSGKEAGRFQVLIKTEVEIPAKVEKLTGISNDLLRMFGVSPKEAYESFQAFVGNEIIVGHNFTTFDSKFLEDAYMRELHCHFPNDFIDTLYLARKVLPDLPGHNLEYLSKKYDIDASKAHRAIEDCIINHSVYEYLTYGKLLCEETDGECPANADISEGWRAGLSGMFPALEKEFGLMENSLSIVSNLGKDNKVSSYAVCVYEPDLVEDKRNGSRNTVLARIKEGVLKSNPNMLSVDSRNPGLKEYGEVTEDMSAHFSIRLDRESDNLIECLVNCIRYGIENYVPKAESFGCCARYEACSKEGKCIHPNLLYAKACAYRKNLENGRVFYR